DQVGRTAALQNLHALGDLEGIANRASEWLIHRIEQIRSFYFHRLAGVRHRFGELFGFLFRFHERAGSEFNVEHQAIEIFRELLAHNTRDDERLRWHRPRLIPQCVKLFVGRTNVLSFSDHKDTDLIQLLERAFFIQVDIKSWDALQFVERAAGNAGSAAGNHWDQTSSHASNGARTSETLSPTPPVDCLSIFGGDPSGYFRIRPLRIIESVRCRVSAGVMPRNSTAMAQALIW